MSIYERGAKWVHLTGATNNTRCIPGDGAGSRLNEVVNTTVVAPNADVTNLRTQARLTATTSVANGQLAITSGGFFGTVTNVNAGTGVITVDKWRNARQDDSGGAGRGPAATETIRFFPAGSCLAGSTKVRLLRMIVTKAVTGVAASHILDYRMATATPVLPWASVVGQFGSVDLDIQLGGPFGLITDTIANFDCTVTFTLN
jgi:hypothetical protein